MQRNAMEHQQPRTRKHRQRNARCRAEFPIKNEGRRGRRDPKTLIRRYAMGYNAKLAVHRVQLRITLTRFTSDYSESPHCSSEPVSSVLLSSLRLRLFLYGIHLSIYSAASRNMRDRSPVISRAQWLEGPRYAATVTPPSFSIT